MLSYVGKLTHLTLDIKREFEIPDVKGKISFPNLRRLEVVAPIASLQVLIGLLDCPLLSHIDIRPHGPCTMAFLRSCVELIAERWPTSIEHLAVRGWRLWSRELHSKQPIPLVPELQPVLTRFTSLRSLELAGSPLFWQNGFHLDLLLRHLCGLRSLKIDLVWEHAGNISDNMIFSPAQPNVNDIMAIPAPTIEAMRLLSRLVPNIESIELPILDMLHIVEPPARWPTPARCVGRFTYVRKRQTEDVDVYVSALRRLYEKMHIQKWLLVPEKMIPVTPASRSAII